MVSRFTLTVLIITLVGLVITGCGTATEPPPTPVSQAAAPADTPAPTTTPEPSPVPPTLPATLAPVTATTAPTEVPPPTEPVAAASVEAAAPAEASAELRTFRIVPEQSAAAYQVQEEFFNRPVNIVNPIGRTQAIEGQFQLTISGSQVQLADNQFSVDLRTLTSDERRRDQRIRTQWLESDKYPLATFKATAIQDFPANAAEGQDIPFKVTGDMTIREITKPQTFDVVARLDGNTFTGTATTNLLMQDYGFEPPSILGMLKVTDGVTVTVNFTAVETAES